MLSVVKICNDQNRTLDIAKRLINILLKRRVSCDDVCKYYDELNLARIRTLCPGLKFGKEKCIDAMLMSCKEDPQRLQRLEDQNTGFVLGGYR